MNYVFRTAEPAKNLIGKQWNLERRRSGRSEYRTDDAILLRFIKLSRVCVFNQPIDLM